MIIRRVPSCTNGACGIASCNMGFANCNMNLADGCEAALASDAMNCGMCGNVCPMNLPSCSNSTCIVNDFPPDYLLYYLTNP